MEHTDYTQLADRDRPVACTTRVGNQTEVFQCADDAELCVEDINAEDIITACNDDTDLVSARFVWEWYDHELHGTTRENLKKLYIDLDDAAREPDEDE